MASSCGCMTTTKPASNVGDLAAAVRMGGSPADVVASVRDYYGKVLETTGDLKTTACLTAVAPSPRIRSILSKVPGEVVARYYGCGSPFPAGIAGKRVLDLGCGSGRDCYVCAALVGSQGFVMGLDMTPGLLEVARRHADTFCTATLGYPASNMAFVEGTIEDLAAAGIADESVDLVISNCVVNLSPDKAAVLAEAYRVLAPGGEVYFSDVYCDHRMPADARTHPVLLGECLGGALYEQDFLRLARGAGFGDPRRLAAPRPIKVGNTQLEALLGDARFFSITYRLFKLPGRLESGPEDYGQAARYRGTVPEATCEFGLDEAHVFQTGKWYEVDGNTAAVVGESWLSRHFEVMGDRSVHYGQFWGPRRLAPAVAAAEAVSLSAGGASCCS